MSEFIQVTVQGRRRLLRVSEIVAVEETSQGLTTIRLHRRAEQDLDCEDAYQAIVQQIQTVTAPSPLLLAT